MTHREGFVVIGGGGHSRVVVATLVALGENNIEIYDDDPAKHGSSILGFPIIGALDRLPVGGAPRRRAVLALGDNRRRAQLATELDLDWQSLTHPAAWVEPSATVGAGSVVMAGAVLQAECRVGRHAIINTGACVDHECRIGDWVHIGPRTALAGGVTVSDGALIGIGSSLTGGRSIGAWAVVGAGAVVLEDVPPETVVAGVPARPL